MAEAKDTPKKHEEILKDLLEIVDIPAEQKEKLNSGLYELEEVKTSFHDTYIAKKMAGSDEGLRSRINGETFRIIKQEINKRFDLGISNDNLLEKKWEDVFEAGMAKNVNAVKALEEQVKTPSEGADQIKTLEASLKEANEKTVMAIEDTQKANQSLEDKTKEFDGQIKQSKIGMLVTNELGKLTFRDDLSDIEKKGFNLLITEGYKFDLDDNNNLKVSDKEGNGVQNEKKTEMLTPGEVLSREATSNKLLKVNNGSQPSTNGNSTNGTSKGVTFDAFGPDKKTNGEQTPAVPEKGKPVLHPSVMKHTEQIETASQK